MKTKHTPGPWYVKFKYHVMASNNRLIAACAGHQDSYSLDLHQTNMDNALLIAAAPDLLAALQFARRIIGSSELGTDDVLGPIDEAIAKATS